MPSLRRMLPLVALPVVVAATHAGTPAPAKYRDAERVEAVVIAQGEVVRLGRKDRQIIHRTVISNEKAVGLAHTIAGNRPLCLKGLQPGISWLTMTNKEGDEEKVLIVVEPKEAERAGQKTGENERRP